MDLIDIGSNLTHESFQHDFDAVVDRAVAAGVRRQIITGTSLAASEAAAHLHHLAPGRFFATAGLHPHHAADLDDDGFLQLERLAASPAVVAVGECGLDYYRNFAPREAQRAAFARQLEIATRLGKPVFLHQRDAHADFMAILREYLPRLADAVAHCFTGHANELDDYLDLGLAVGITGWICDERRGEHLKSLVPRIPADRLMIETDSPYLLPRSLRPKPEGRRNEPAFLIEVARVVAESRQESIEALATSTTKTAERFFRLPA
ncbi:MAG: hypothetical protein RLZZ200_484 [Pseudomonadota bacterium]|jgi:TatD DNase family protein